MSAPREMTDDEVREAFLSHVRRMVAYWASEGNSNVPAAASARERLEGLAFSLLVAIDGAADALPAFVLAPVPHEDDRAFHASEGNNWFPSAGAVEHDIAGGLHEHFHKMKGS